MNYLAKTDFILQVMALFNVTGSYMQGLATGWKCGLVVCCIALIWSGQKTSEYFIFSILGSFSTLTPLKLRETQQVSESNQEKFRILTSSFDYSLKVEEIKLLYMNTDEIWGFGPEISFQSVVSPFSTKEFSLDGKFSPKFFCHIPFQSKRWLARFSTWSLFEGHDENNEVASWLFY